MRYRIVKGWLMQMMMRAPASGWWGLRRSRRGSVAVMAAGGMVPLFIGIGVAVDMGRLAMAQNALQAATDEAALAGATAYGASGTADAAQKAATTYFNQAVALQQSLLTNATATPTAAPGQFSPSIAGNNVTVSATATMPTTFLGIAGLRTVSMKASSTAANPWGPNNTWQPVVASGFLGSSAYDWNSVYIYAEPVQNGSPNFNYIPSLSQIYEVASNCSATFSTGYQSGAACAAWPGAVPPANQTFPAVQANQPLAVVMFNMTSGQRDNKVTGTGSNARLADAYASNQYSSCYGDMRLIATAELALGHAPAGLNDSPNSSVPCPNVPTVLPGSGPANPPTPVCNNPAANTPDYYVGKVWPTGQGMKGPNQSRPCDNPSHYSDVNNSSTPNCSLIIQQIDPANPPSQAPYPAGTCFSLNDPRAGLQYANLSCAQINGRTFAYWFNDMGGGSDDKDYNDMVFALTCNPTGANPNGGNFKQSGTAPAATTTTALIQ